MSVLTISEVDRAGVALLLLKLGLDLRMVPTNDVIPGTYWGESEAGLSGNTLYARADTPLHSVLHETAHFVCMTPERRVGLHRDAGGDDGEENAVCYLQILLADELQQLGRKRMCADMDEWGYSFRLGSARAWFESDADDARLWLIDADIISPDGRVTGRLRIDSAADQRANRDQ
jgi:hypothetical protein